MKYKAVFFDFDGTLMNTSEGIYKGAEFAISKVGIEIKGQIDWDSFIGPPLHECFRLAFKIEDNEILDKLCAAYREYYSEQGMKEAIFYDEILDTIQFLRSMGCKTAIASMKNTYLVKKMCDYFKISSLFDKIYGLNLSENNTKADILKQAMRDLKLKPSQCVLVGDTYIDEMGALQAGCKCIKAGWGFGFKSSEKDVVSKPSDIIKKVI